VTAKHEIGGRLHFRLLREVQSGLCFKDIPELYGLTVVLALSVSDVSRIGLMPGSAASASAQLAQIRGCHSDDAFPSLLTSDLDVG